MYLPNMEIIIDIVYRLGIQVDLHWIQRSKDLRTIRTMACTSHRRKLLGVNWCHGSR
jgi:hypothetical protein